MTIFRTLAVSICALAGVGATASLAQQPAAQPGAEPAPAIALAPDPAAPPNPDLAPLPAAPGPSVAHTSPPAGFEDCAACHGVTKDALPMIGPNLWGVGGRKAAGGPDYEYSPAMKAHAVTWTPETLQPFIVNPMGTVPGTTMAYPGIPDPAAAKAIADYLMTLKD